MERPRYAAVHLYVSGMVQGVGFRFFTINRARAYGITGWIKNLYDGRVEIEAEGKNENLSLFLKDIKIGPSYAHVSNVIEQWREIKTPGYKNFTIAF